MSDSRLGETIELPWWVVPLAVPPLAVAVLGIVLTAPLWAHLLAVLSSLATLLILARIATNIPSRSMQSVWISTLYAVWFFIALTWAVVVATATTA
jgi:hypothetical protein